MGGEGENEVGERGLERGEEGRGREGISEGGGEEQKQRANEAKVH